jgi:ABC-type sugar transport system permease subunit
MGYAAAMAWFLFLIILVITLVQWRVIGRHVEYA